MPKVGSKMRPTSSQLWRPNCSTVSSNAMSWKLDVNKIQEEEEEEFTCSKDHAGVDPFIAKTPSLFWVKVFMICSPSSLVRIGLLITVQNLPFVIHHILYNPCSLFSLRNVCTDQNQELDSRFVELFCSHKSEAGFHFC